MWKREAFLNEVLENIGSPYIYGGQSPKGFDCSGFIVYCANKIGIKMPDMNVKTMTREYFHNYKIFPALSVPGDLLFYGETALTLSHVMVLIKKWENGAMIVAGARGGNNTTKTIDIARNQGAFVDVNIDYWKKNLQIAVNPFSKWGE